jgi:uncharacterized protein YbjT (DUF2867 family)
MILVVGATGLLGTRVCERLRAEGQPVRALVRRTSDHDKVNALRSLGCELAIGDLKEPPQIEAACKGITAVVSTASATLSRQQGDSIESVDLQGQLSLADAAKTAGVRRFIYASFRDDPTVQYPLTEAKRSVERAIADFDFTSIQASWFMEVWLSLALDFDYVHGKVRLYGSGSKPISWVSYRDVAEFCVAPALRSVAARSVIAVGGPERQGLYESRHFVPKGVEALFPSFRLLGITRKHSTGQTRLPATRTPQAPDGPPDGCRLYLL